MILLMIRLEMVEWVWVLTCEGRSLHGKKSGQQHGIRIFFVQFAANDNPADTRQGSSELISVKSSIQFFVHFICDHDNLEVIEPTFYWLSADPRVRIKGDI